ncbi:hypothetical protein D3C75_981270 [compost metagenome]
MAVLAAGKFTERFPGFYRHVAVSFRREGEDHLRGVNRRLDARAAFRRAVELDVIQLAEEIDLILSVPRNAFPAVAQLVEQWAKRGKAFVGFRIITLDHRNVRRGFTGDQIAFAFAPVGDVEWLRQFGRRVVL